MNPTLEISSWEEYELLDSGAGRKLERFGEVVVDRGEPKAWWRPRLSDREWKAAAARHEEGGGWQTRGKVPEAWPLRRGGLRFELRFSRNSKHLGLFPEQAPHWDRVRRYGPERPGGRTLLNLFGYTGAATLAAAEAGFAVTHVDASKPAVAWARVNQERSGLTQAPVRWIVDDALKFVQREARRGRRYDALLLDPPSFGRGPSGELWKAERDVVTLLDACAEILSDRPVLVLMTLYAIEASSVMIANLLGDLMKGRGGTIDIGELVLPHAGDDRLLPLSIYGCWSDETVAATSRR